MAAAEQPWASHGQDWQGLIKILETVQGAGENSADGRKIHAQTAGESRVLVVWLRTHPGKHPERQEPSASH